MMKKGMGLADMAMKSKKVSIMAKLEKSKKKHKLNKLL